MGRACNNKDLSMISTLKGSKVKNSTQKKVAICGRKLREIADMSSSDSEYDSSSDSGDSFDNDAFIEKRAKAL